MYFKNNPLGHVELRVTKGGQTYIVSYFPTLDQRCYGLTHHQPDLESLEWSFTCNNRNRKGAMKTAFCLQTVYRKLQTRTMHQIIFISVAQVSILPPEEL